MRNLLVIGGNPQTLTHLQFFSSNKTAVNSASGNARQSTRPVLKGNGNRSNRQLGPLTRVVETGLNPNLCRGSPSLWWLRAMADPNRQSYVNNSPKVITGRSGVWPGFYPVLSWSPYRPILYTTTTTFVKLFTPLPSTSEVKDTMALYNVCNFQMKKNFRQQLMQSSLLALPHRLSKLRKIIIKQLDQ